MGWPGPRARNRTAHNRTSRGRYPFPRATESAAMRGRRPLPHPPLSVGGSCVGMLCGADTACTRAHTGVGSRGVSGPCATAVRPCASVPVRDAVSAVKVSALPTSRRGRGGGALLGSATPLMCCRGTAPNSADRYIPVTYAHCPLDFRRVFVTVRITTCGPHRLHYGNDGGRIPAILSVTYLVPDSHIPGRIGSHHDGLTGAIGGHSDHGPGGTDIGHGLR